jgi:rRNA maturation endonuclease Nob1
MKICLNCKEENWLSDKFCVKCGEMDFKDITKRCLNCKSYTGDHMIYCGSCGHRIDRKPVNNMKLFFDKLWSKFK